MPVDSKHPDFCTVEKDWRQIRHCIAGQRIIKKHRERYLPKPNAADVSAANEARYEAYLLRALFYNATARTVTNMQGQCFSVDPVATVPPEMEPWLDDIDAAGVNIIQQSKQALGYVVAYSRAGIWVDYPKTSGTVSKAQEESGEIRPKITLVSPENIINWRTTPVGAKSKLSLVVIKETYIKSDDGYLATMADQYRVLRLTAGVYTMDLFRADGGTWAKVETNTPTKGDGSGTWDEIPFCFIGVEANDCNVEKPLMLDISNVNIAHYRNSADYEEMTYMVGQPTAWIAGLDDAWIDNHFKNGVMLGSRAIIPLPREASAGLLQAAAETLPKDAMDQKEELMTALGAKLVEKSQVQQTATEAGLNEASETSILASCCKNVSAAYATGLGWCAIFANVQMPKKPVLQSDGTTTTAQNTDDILFELNTEFAVSRMTAQEQTALLGLKQGELITFTEARDKLKSGGIAYLDDETAKDEIATEADQAFAKSQQELAAQTQSQKDIITHKAENPPAPAPKPTA